MTLKQDAPSFGGVLFKNDNYRLTVRPGMSEVAVLSFCGVGLALGGIQTEEFKSSLGPAPTAYYIADLQRSWWNNAGIEEVLELAMSHARSLNPAIQFAAVGNSMGGSGAILAAHLYSEIRRCLAFVPQFDVRLGFEEKRWMEYRQRIHSHRWETFALPPKSADCRLVFGDQKDHAHRSGFVAAGFPIALYEEYDHDVARELRNRMQDEYNSLLRFLME